MAKSKHTAGWKIAIVKDIYPAKDPMRFYPERERHDNGMINYIETYFE